MILEIKDILDLPNKSIIKKRIPKNQFQKEIDKRGFEILSSDIDSMYIYSILNRLTVNITPLKNQEYNVSEIIVLVVELRNQTNIKKVENIIHSVIPNPVVLILFYGQSFNISVAMKRLNKNNDMKVIHEEIFSSDFINLDNLKEYEKKFLALIKLSKHPQINLYELYRSLERHILVTVLFEYIGNYISDSRNIEMLLPLIESYEELNREMKKYEKNKKSESSFGRQLEWHVEIKKIEKKIEDIKQKMEELC